MTVDNPVNINMDVKASADFDPLIKATPKGLSRLFSLLFGKREAENLKYKILTAAQTQRECQQILSGKCDFVDGQLVLIEDSMSTGCLNPMQVELEQQTRNLAGNLRMAAEALKDIPDEKISDKEVDEDFFARWRREAKVIGDKDLQRLWGRLLAEEIKNQGDISFRALDTLKNITSAEAKLFQSIAKYILGPAVIVCNPVSRTLPPKVLIDDLLLLHDSGLSLNVDSNIVGSVEEKITINGVNYIAIDAGKYIFTLPESGHNIRIPGIALTSAGAIALRICDVEDLTINDAFYIWDALKRNNSDEKGALLLYEKIPNGDTMKYNLLTFS